jgi:hypothetical protein
MPRNYKKTSRAPERDYSHRSLMDKLGVKPAHYVVVLGTNDAAFLRGLAARTSNVSFGASRKLWDVFFLGVEIIEDLENLPSASAFPRKDAAVWVVYPRGRTEIRERDVLAAGKSAGLTDNKVARFSDTHTALRFVVPLAKR